MVHLEPDLEHEPSEHCWCNPIYNGFLWMHQHITKVIEATLLEIDFNEPPQKP